MARGSVAKENAVKIMAQAFGQNWIGEYDKKYYIWSTENGEKVQIAISLTCPKTPIEVDSSVCVDGGDWDFSDEPKVNNTVAVANAAPAEITEEEKQNLADLMARLGL